MMISYLDYYSLGGLIHQRHLLTVVQLVVEVLEYDGVKCCTDV